MAAKWNSLPADIESLAKADAFRRPELRTSETKSSYRWLKQNKKTRKD
jgi:hypothetical protein